MQGIHQGRDRAGGSTPVSLTVHDDRLYVLNQGSDQITGFRIHRDGRLAPIDGSTQALHAAHVVGVQVSLSAGGDFLVASEKIGGDIDVFARAGSPAASGSGR